jgi:hypothetical protein
MRVQSDRPAKNGGSIHSLSGGPAYHFEELRLPAAQPERETSLAPIDRRNQVYRRLQEAMGLIPIHQQALLARSYTAEEIKARRYRSLLLCGRSRRARLAAGTDPQAPHGVPGFYLASGDNGDYWTFTGKPGLLIPCLDPHGRIQAFRIRPDDPGEEGGKYRWLSSGGRPGGTGSRVWCHVARPLTADPDNNPIWVVEGELKADLAAERLGAVVVSVPGVDTWSLALPVLAELLPHGGRVIVAMDADWREKPAVHGALWSLALACSALGYSTEVALWELTHKGLDDLLVAGQNPTLKSPAEISKPAWTLKVSSRVLATISYPGQSASLSLGEIRRRLPEVIDSLFQSM